MLVENRITPEERTTLIAGVRNASERVHRVEINRQNVGALSTSVQRPRDPMDAGDRVLLYLRSHSAHFSARVPIDYDFSYPLFGLKNREELADVISYLTSQNYVSVVTGTPPEFWIATPGYTRLRELDRRPHEARQIFVAMSFANQYRDAYQLGIARAIREHRYDPVRMDQLEHNDRIDDRIIAEIRKSAAIVADFSGLRSGVFFEAGVALGLGLPIIWTCHTMDFSTLRDHFDTRQFNHIKWAEPSDLRASLAARLGATVPVGPLSEQTDANRGRA